VVRFALQSSNQIINAILCSGLLISKSVFNLGISVANLSSNSDESSHDLKSSMVHLFGTAQEHIVVNKLHGDNIS
jgi:hypothetical protein